MGINSTRVSVCGPGSVRPNATSNRWGQTIGSRTSRQAMVEFIGFLRENQIVGKGLKGMELEKEVPIGQHKLPPLPYAYNALEPFIDEQTMRLHHDKHHQSYVDGLNKAEKMMAAARESGDFELLRHWERAKARTLVWEPY